MVVVAQLVRASDCGSEGRRFETGLPPKTQASGFSGAFFVVIIFPLMRRNASSLLQQSGMQQDKLPCFLE